MKAILRLLGSSFDFYTLDQGNPRGDLAWEFLTAKSTEGYAKGFLILFRRIAAEGFDGIANELCKCWEVEGVDFCEFKRRPWRLSYFVLHERRILLTHPFRKKRDKQPKEYRKAVKLLRKFQEHEEWKDKDE
jgi:hypothetical protein